MESCDKSTLSGRIQMAITLLHEPLTLFVGHKNIAKLQGSKLGFSQLLYAIRDNWKKHFANCCSMEMKKIIARAVKIRNDVCHQDFDFNDYEHSMEQLAKLASLIQRPDVEQNISALFRIATEGGKISEKNWLLLKEEGNKFYAQERWTEAMNCYTKAIQNNSKEAVLYSNRALCELQLKKYALAREDAEDAIDLDPTKPKYYRTLSESLLSLKLFSEAKIVCEQALKLDTRDGIHLLRLRDCNALIVQEETDANPIYGLLNDGKYEDIQTEAWKQLSTYVNKMKKFTPKPEDVTIIRSFEEFLNHNGNFDVAKAHELFKGSNRNPKSEEKAVEIYERIAKQGNAEAMYCLGILYSQARGGLPRDLLKARELFYKAASQIAFYKINNQILPNIGVAEAENTIGSMFRDGKGEDVNKKKAFEWYLKAAEHGSDEAYNNLGIALTNGYGCKVDLASARTWFEKSVESGIAEAQKNLAGMLISGAGGEKDVQRAAKLYKAAADQGLPSALAALQTIMRSGALGGSVAAESQTLVKETAVKSNDPNAYFLLGYNHFNGEGGAVKDLNLAEIYWKQAIELGCNKALFTLSLMFFETKRNEEGFTYLLKAAELGQAEAYAPLSKCYAFGVGCIRDEVMARRFFRKAILVVQIADDEKLNDKDIENWLQGGKQLEEFETMSELNNQGLSLSERLNRLVLGTANKSTKSVVSKEDRVFCVESIINMKSQPAPLPDSFSLKMNIFTWIPEMIARANNGSQTAANFVNAMQQTEHSEKLIHAGMYGDGFRELRLGRRLWDQSIYDKILFLNAANKILDENPNNAEALFALSSNNDRLSVNERIEMIKRCVELDPFVADFHHMLGCMFGFANKFECALRAFNRSLELDYCLSWLYDKATALRMLLKSDKETTGKGKYDVNRDDAREAINTYEDFLNRNPPDHRKVPEAYYSIGSIYLNLKDKEKAKHYWKKGNAAEDPSVRLPCFEPVDDTFPPRELLKIFMHLKGKGKREKGKRKKEKGSEKGKSLFNQKKCDDVVENACSSCSLVGAKLYRCSACKTVWYCSKDCQNKDWKIHKKICHKN